MENEDKASKYLFRLVAVYLILTFIAFAGFCAYGFSLKSNIVARSLSYGHSGLVRGVVGVTGE